MHNEGSFPLIRKEKSKEVIEHELFKLGKLDQILREVARDFRVDYSSFQKIAEGYTNKACLHIMLSKDGCNRNLVVDGRVAASDIAYEFTDACADLVETGLTGRY